MSRTTATTRRTPDTTSMADMAVRTVMAVVVTAVAGVAAWTSYVHTVAVVIAHGEDTATARLLPITTDGLILGAGLVLLDAARSGRRAPVLARLMLAAGIGATLAANALHGATSGPVGAAVAAWPAATFVGVSELALLLVRTSARPADAAVCDWVPKVLPPRPADVPTARAGRRPDVAVAATSVRPDVVTARVASSPAARTRSSSTGDADPDVAAMLAADPDITGAEIGRRRGVSARHGRRLLAAAAAAGTQ